MLFLFMQKVPFRKLPVRRERHTQPRKEEAERLIWERERKGACELRGKMKPESIWAALGGKKVTLQGPLE